MGTRLKNIWLQLKDIKTFTVGIAFTVLGAWWFYEKTTFTDLKGARFYVGLIVSFISYYVAIISSYIVLSKILKDKQLKPLLEEDSTK